MDGKPYFVNNLIFRYYCIFTSLATKIHIKNNKKKKGVQVMFLKKIYKWDYSLTMILVNIAVNTLPPIDSRLFAPIKHLT